MESGKLTRVTLIAPDGRVIYDNHVAAEKMLNHKDREEVQEALASGIGLAQRMSDTLSEKKLFILRCGWIMVYTACCKNDRLCFCDGGRKYSLYDRGSAGGGFGGYASGTADY